MPAARSDAPLGSVRVDRRMGVPVPDIRNQLVISTRRQRLRRRIKRTGRFQYISTIRNDRILSTPINMQIISGEKSCLNMFMTGMDHSAPQHETVSYDVHVLIIHFEDLSLFAKRW